MVILRSTAQPTKSKCYAPFSLFDQEVRMLSTKAVVTELHFHFIEEAPDIVVEGARLPSILRLASCLSS